MVLCWLLLCPHPQHLMRALRCHQTNCETVLFLKEWKVKVLLPVLISFDRWAIESILTGNKLVWFMHCARQEGSTADNYNSKLLNLFILHNTKLLSIHIWFTLLPKSTTPDFFYVLNKWDMRAVMRRVSFKMWCILTGGLVLYLTIVAWDKISIGLHFTISSRGSALDHILKNILKKS